jgi:2-oxoglutarate dehydrogenase E1 component
LRNPQAVSSLHELADGTFQRVLRDDRQDAFGQISKILLCTGKVYYELRKYRQDFGADDVALLRLEQLYPLDRKALESALAPYPAETPVLWVQEEPENMGAWRFLRVNLGERLFDRFPFSGQCRPASASPATGSNNAHKIEQERLLEAAFAGRRLSKKSDAAGELAAPQPR